VPEENPLQAAVSPEPERPALAMESHSKVAGHPLHPILIVFPLGLLGTSVIYDFLYARGKDPKTAATSQAMITSGIAGGLAAAVPGLIDWMAIPLNTRAKQVGQVHGLGNVAVLGLFGASWLLRRKQPDYAPTSAAVVLSLAGAGLAGFTGWLGGELIHRLGVSVDAGAHLDAPNSLIADADGTPKSLTEAAVETDGSDET
jgi:uncharacterized membrane protein